MNGAHTAESVLEARGPGVFLLQLIISADEMRHLDSAGLGSGELARLLAIVLRGTETVTIEKLTSLDAYQLSIRSVIGGNDAK